MDTAPSFEKAPIRTSVHTVLPEWIDYNGHMNVAYYTLAFDRAIDEVYEMLRIGPTLVAEHNMGPMTLQSQIHYLGELLEGERFYVEMTLVDSDAKRTHSMCLMRKEADDALAATYESLSVNVDLEARRSAPYPPDALARIEALRDAHAGIARPPQMGAPLGIRRKG
jgi:acyl-CoA thioester hydrolase